MTEKTPSEPIAFADATAEAAWRDAMKDPEAQRSLERALDDLHAGRTSPMGDVRRRNAEGWPMFERGDHVIVRGHRGREAVLTVWQDQGRGLTLTTDAGFVRALAGDPEAPLVGFPRRDVKGRVESQPVTPD